MVNSEMNDNTECTVSETLSISNDRMGGEQGRRVTELLFQQQQRDVFQFIGRDTELRCLGYSDGCTDSLERSETQCTEQQRSARLAHQTENHQL